MYTIENLVDDDIIFPFEYGASASEMWSLLLNFPRNRENLEELELEVRICRKFMERQGKKHVAQYFTMYLNYAERLSFPNNAWRLEISKSPELRAAMNPIAELLCSEKKQKKEWIKDKQNGQGMLKNEFGDEYNGEIRNFLPNGKGIVTFKEGGKYEGDFKDGEFNGLGKASMGYEGNFKNGLFDGQGRITFSNGNKFEGEFKFGRRHGYGAYYDSKGEITSESEYRYSRLHGQSTSYQDGVKIVREFNERPYPYNYNPRIWNQIEYYSDGKILERVKDGEYLIIKGENVSKKE